MKRVFTLLIAIILIAACSKQEPLPENYNELIRSHVNAGKSAKALKLIDRVLIEKTDLQKNAVVSLKRKKLDILMKDKNYQDALTLAIDIEKTSERKSPYRVLSIVECYLHLGKTDEAIPQVYKMIDLGFKDVHQFDEAPFDVIKKSDKFEEIKAKINENIGIGKEAKDFTLTDINGNSVKLSDLKGKVVLVDFWATWCPPCRKEIPALVEYYNELNKEGFEILGVSLDFENALEDVKKFIEKENMGWPVFYSGKGWSDQTASYYGVNSIPSTWLIDKNGVLKYFGLHGEHIKEKVKELLSE